MVLALASFLLFSACVCAASQGCALWKIKGTVVSVSMVEQHKTVLKALKAAEAAHVTTIREHTHPGCSSCGRR